MPIEAPAGTLEVENAKFRASSVEATIAVGIGTDSNDAYPLQVFKETAPDIRIREGSTISSAARLYSNNSNLYIQTGTDFTAGSSGDVAFQTMGGQSTHMVIKSDGKVGVGADNPLGKAHIYADDAASGTQLFIENASTSNRTGLVLRNGDGEDFRIQHTSGSSNAGIIENLSTVNGGINFYAKGDGEYQFRTTDSNTLRMVIENDGKVGIGTGSPDTLCDLLLASGTNYSNTVALTIRNYSSDYTQIENGFGSRIQFITNRGTSSAYPAPSADIKGYVYSGAGTTGDYHALDLDVYGDNGSLNKGISILSTSDSGGPADTIMHGNVGIGVTNPSAKLHVNGSIKHGNYNKISGGSTGGYKDLGNDTVLLWGWVEQYVTNAAQYNWTWYFPDSLTLSETYCAVAEISDAVRGLSYPGAFTLLGIGGLNTNRITGHLKSQDVSNGTIYIWIMAIGKKT